MIVKNHERKGQQRIQSSPQDFGAADFPCARVYRTYIDNTYTQTYGKDQVAKKNYGRFKTKWKSSDPRP